MERAIERHKRGKVRVIPIILRPVYWQGEPLGKLQALPTDVKLVTSWHDIDEALLNVTEEIGAGYSLFGPKKKSYLSITQTAFRQLILTKSFIGITIYIIANTLPALWTVYIGLDFYVVGYILAIIQVFRLKHVKWVEEKSEYAILILPFLFFGILYAIFSPKVEEN
jgi:hypothetical protein